MRQLVNVLGREARELVETMNVPNRLGFTELKVDN